jgi:mono/diheme cytochrome c family protein
VNRIIVRRPLVDLFLAIVALVGLVAVLGVASAGQQARLGRHASRQQAHAVENGAELYAEHCRACHGVRGEGVGQLGPALNDRAFFEARLAEVGWQGTLAEYVQSAVSHGRVTATRPFFAADGAVAMAPWAQALGGPLRPDEVENVTAFVLNWEASALGKFQPAEIVLPTPTPGDSAEAVSRGQALWEAAGCAVCHQIGANGGDAGPDLSRIASVAASRVPDLSAEAYLRESFLLPNLFVVEGYAASAGCGGVLSQRQLDDLIAYLLTLE